MSQTSKTIRTANARNENKITVVIGNAPSAQQWDLYHSPTIVCNRGVFDHIADHCVIIDRFCIAELIDSLPQGVEYWTKTSPLELPPGFKQIEAPGIDSGSLAIHLAQTLYPNNTTVCVGFDGILRENTNNRYTYKFRGHTHRAKAQTYERYRSQAIKLAQTAPTLFVGNVPDSELEVIDYESAVQMVRE